MRFEPLIGLRYVRSGRGSRFISFISLMATAGIALGVAALIIVMSVMNGFQKEVRDRMLSVISHVELVAGTYDPVDWREAEALLRAQPGVQEVSPFILGQAMVAQGGQIKGILARGIDPSREPLVSPVLGRLDTGELSDLQPGAFGLVVGREFAESRRLKLGDSLLMITADAAGGPAGIVPRMKNFTVVGIFHTGHYEYDSSLVLMHERDAQALFRAQGLKGIRAQLQRTDDAPAIALSLRRQAPEGLFVRDWTAENRTWFTAVQLEKRMMFLILALIIAVAAFNLVSMLVMTVMDKRADIAILRTVGAQRGSILSIFVVQGAVLGVLGTLSGVLLGVLGAIYIDAIVSFVEGLAGLQILPKGAYFIDQLPSDLRLGDVLQVGAMALVLSLLATLYPAWQASKTDPAEALRDD